jgi:hypothetical protein
MPRNLFIATPNVFTTYTWLPPPQQRAKPTKSFCKLTDPEEMNARGERETLTICDESHVGGHILLQRLRGLGLLINPAIYTLISPPPSHSRYP